jgi:hypothetical protein
VVPAAHFVTVEWSYMRGEDEVYDVCDRHRQMAREQFSRFIDHLISADAERAKRRA